ncbi:MAG: VCBS repeat-containing protein [Planctomycetes bacterium]|nr:VCBS repeat-containing protein [Planctomycetota bacterium]
MSRSALVVTAVLVAMLGLIALALRPGSVPPAPPAHRPPKPVEPGLSADPREEFVYDLERAVEQFRVAVTQESTDQILECFADGFSGDTLFDGTPAAPTVEAAHVRIAPRPSRPHAITRDEIRDFYRTIDAVTFFGTKVAEAERDGTDRAKAVIKWSLHARAGAGHLQIQERYRAALRFDGRWRFVSMERIDGRRVASDRTLFEPVPFPIDPDIRCHGCAYRTPQIHLGGVALADANGDGTVDVFTVGPAASHLFLNRDGRFVETTANAGLGRQGAGAVFLDYDNDGDLDLLVTDLNEDSAIRLYRNRGDATFEEVTDAARLRKPGNAYSACAADIDRDGDLDLYVGFYGGPKIDTDGHVAYGLDTESFLDANNGEPDVLFRNNGDGTFTDVTAAAGIREKGWTLACGFQDVDGDGDADLYVVHDFGFNTLYRNKGDGTFEDATDAAGVRDAGFGMGLARADFDGDGDLDLYVSNMSSTAGARIIGASKDLSDDLRRRMTKAAAGNTLLRNDRGRFENVADPAGVGKAGWAWGCVFTDADNDGRPDLYVANGFVSGRHRTDL